MISYFQPPITNTLPQGSLSLYQVYQKIIGPEYTGITETLRSLEDPRELRQFKAQHFPYVTFAGTFEKRNDKNLLTPSGLMVIDLDDLPELEAVREDLLAQTCYETELLFVSPSGRGLKWVTSYPHTEIDHKEQFKILCSYLEAVFDLQADPSGKDLSRACFLCQDEDVYLSEKHQPPP